MPDLRVVIPAYRAEATIRDCVAAVAIAARIMAHEIVVVDDGGNPNLEARLIDLPALVVRTPIRGSAARARNVGAHGFKGRILAFVDSDVIVAPDCLGHLLAPLLDRRADATMGNYSNDTTGLGFGASYKQIYISCVYARRAGYQKNDFWTAIGAVTVPAFRAVGEFDVSFAGANGEDAQFGRALTAQGYRIMGLPDAVAQHRHPLTIAQVFANDWRKGVIAMRDCLLSHQSKLSDNKHATPRDWLAVLLVIALIGAAILAPLSPCVMLSAMTMILAVYLATRADLVGSFASRGVCFATQAACLMGMLDLLRAACAAFGMTTYWTRRYRGLRSPIAPPGPASFSHITLDSSYENRCIGVDDDAA